METNYRKIDLQHKKLFNVLNRIARAYHDEKGAEEIFNTLDFLTKYTILHFNYEEKHMKALNYPGYAAHKKDHDSFKITVAEFTLRLQAENPTEELIVAVTTALGDWLINHIRIEDNKMGAFLKSKES